MHTLGKQIITLELGSDLRTQDTVNKFSTLKLPQMVSFYSVLSTSFSAFTSNFHRVFFLHIWCWFGHTPVPCVSQFNLLQWQKINPTKKIWMVLCWFSELDLLPGRSGRQQTQGEDKNIQPRRRQRWENRWEAWEEGGEQESLLLAYADSHCICSSVSEPPPCTNSSGCCLS